MALRDTIHHHADWISSVPFAAAWLGTRSADRPLLTRAAEQLLTAAFAAGIAIYINDKAQDQKIDALQAALKANTESTRYEITDLRAEFRAALSTVLQGKPQCPSATPSSEHGKKREPTAAPPPRTFGIYTAATATTATIKPEPTPSADHSPADKQTPASADA